MWRYIIAGLPFVLLVLLAVWGGRMKRLCQFRLPVSPKLPYAKNPGLALEIADSQEFLAEVLGKSDSELGEQNRKIAEKLQKLDFYFIAFYVLFFGSVALQPYGRSWGALLVIVSVLLTAVFDILEDLAILGILRDPSASPPKKFGQMKWAFYFLTLGIGGISLFLRQSSTRVTARNILGTLLIIIAVYGISSAACASFKGIAIATKMSMLGLIGLALTPIF